MIIMKMFHFSFLAHHGFLAVCLFLLPSFGFGLVGSTSFVVEGGNSTNPTYYIASAPVSEDSVYSGTVASTVDSNRYLLFDYETNSSGSISYPFHGDSVFVPGVQTPEMSVSISSGAVSSPSVTWQPGTWNSNKPKFNPLYPPEVVLYDADCNTSAEVNATLDGVGKLTGLTVVNAGDGYTSTPKVKVIAGPHFVKITDSNNPYNGRVFLIEDNNRTRLQIDLSRKAESESSNVSTYFPVGTQIVVIPATTLGSLFGTDFSELPSNWSYGLPANADWIYVWDVIYGGYHPYFFLGTSAQHLNYGRGWYAKDSTVAGILNHTVVYPDEAFLIAKRTSGTVTLEFEGEIETTDKSLFLPKSGNQILAKNPYGADMLLAELIPSTAITTHDGNATLFRAREVSSGEGDVVTLLEGAVWKQFYYKESAGNTAVTSMHILGSRRPLDGSDGNATTMTSDDFLIDSGTVTAIDSCNENGQTGQSDTSYSKLTITGANTTDLKGFTVVLDGLQGYLLYEDNLNEINASTGAQVTSVTQFSQLASSAARGSIVDSNLNGSHEIVKSGSSFIVLDKQRDVNFKSDEGSPVWKIGNIGTGYSAPARFYCVGGNGISDSNATGTISTTGAITVSTNGSGYISTPHTIISGGGWRYQDDNPRDNEILGASTGLLLQRNSLSGDKSYIESLNPFE